MRRREAKRVRIEGAELGDMLAKDVVRCDG